MTSFNNLHTTAVLVSIVVLLYFHATTATPCTEKNCKPPNCRCWEDRKTPGNLAKSKTPQMVLLTFGNSINRATKYYSQELMLEIANPNGCPARATFFIEELNTNPREVKNLYEAGYEIGLSLKNDTIPQNPKEWLANIKDVKQRMVAAGIPEYSLRGFRSSQLYAGGDELMEVLKDLDIQYDTTCVNRQFVEMENTLWPYTYDYPDHVPHCLIGRTPRKPHNGTWQILMPVLKYGDHFCSSPSGCGPYLNNSAENVYKFLFENFLQHYNGNRAPFNLYLDPLWLTNPTQFKATRNFIELLEALNDVWIVTFQQALFWMKSPVDSEDAKKYPPWSCGKDSPFAPYSRR